MFLVPEKKSPLLVRCRPYNKLQGKFLWGQEFEISANFNRMQLGKMQLNHKTQHTKMTGFK